MEYCGSLVWLFDIKYDIPVIPWRERFQIMYFSYTIKMEYHHVSLSPGLICCHWSCPWNVLCYWGNSPLEQKGKRGEWLLTSGGQRRETRSESLPLMEVFGQEAVAAFTSDTRQKQYTTRLTDEQDAYGWEKVSSGSGCIEACACVCVRA